jgi:hypothetical protein
MGDRDRCGKDRLSPDENCIGLIREKVRILYTVINLIPGE